MRGRAEWTKNMNNNIINAMQGGNTLLMVNAHDLREFAFSILDEAKKMALESEKKEKYLTETEVCQILNVTHTTLWRWNRDGYLSIRKIGRRSMWAQSDIDKLMMENCK